MGSRTTQITILLVVVAIVLSVLARATAMPNWVIIVVFVVAAVAANYAWPGRSGKD